MTVGGVLGEAWETYKRFFRQFVLTAFIVYVLLDLLNALVSEASTDDTSTVLLWALVATVIEVVGYFWVQAALIELVHDVRDGRADLSISETLDRAMPHVGTLALAGLLAGLAITVGLFLLIVPGLYLLTIWLVIIPAIMLENCGVTESFARSQGLVRGYGWSVFGVIVLSVLIVIGISILYGVLRSAVDSEWAGLALYIVVYSATAPFLALAWTTTYYELRDLKGAEPTAAV